VTDLPIIVVLAALYLTLYLLVIGRIVARIPPDIGIPAPPPGRPRPYIQGASMLVVPLDPATAEAVRKLGAAR